MKPINLRACLRPALAAGLTLLLSLPAAGFAQTARPSAEEALAFLRTLPPVSRKIDGKPQLVQIWKDKTVQDIKTMTTLTPGGHVEGGAHLRMRGDDWKYFTAFERLEKAELWEIDGADDTAFRHLGNLPQSVNWLYVEVAELTDEGVRHLQGLKNLNYLGIGWTKTIGDGALPHMARISSLEHILVSGCKGVTGSGVASLAGLKNLKKLDIADTSVTDATLPAFARLPVEELNLSQNKVSAASLKKLLSDAGNLPNLKVLTLKKAGINEADAKALQEARPGLKVVR